MGEEYRKALLTLVRKVTPWNGAEIVSHIIDRHTSTEIEQYVNGSDAAIPALVDEWKKSTMSKARSLGPDYPPLSGNSQGQSSYTSEGTQAASAGRLGTSQLPVSSIVPDDGMRDSPPPSLNSQAHQPSDTFERIQALPAHQIGISLLPDSSSAPDDGMRDFQPSSSGTIQSWPDTCQFYMSRRGICLKGFSCEYSHGFGPSGKLEMEIRLLLMATDGAVLLEDLPLRYFDCYKKCLPLTDIWDTYSLQTFLRPLHTISWGSHSYEQKFLFLLGHPAYLRVWNAANVEEPTLIYINFSARSRSICTKDNVTIYFRYFGPVLSVTIPNLSTYGFVRFQYPETVSLLLSEWNPWVPHFIYGEAVRVRPYIPKEEAKLKNTAGKHWLETGCDLGIVTGKSSATSAPEIAPPLTHSQPSHSQMETDPLKGGEATGLLVEMDPSEVLLGEQVPDVLAIDPLEGEQVPGGVDGASR